MAKCGAKTVAGGRCQRQPMPNGRCYRHGGATPSGPASPHFIHGRYSTALPKGLVERFTASMTDPDLLELRAELSLVDARIEELLGRITAQEADGCWSEAKTVYQRLRVAYEAQKPTATTALAELGDILERGDADVERWGQLGQLINLRARVVRVESKRLKDLHQMVTVERVWALVAALVQSVRKHVADRGTLSRIQQDFRQLTGRTAAATHLRSASGTPSGRCCTCLSWSMRWGRTCLYAGESLDPHSGLSDG